MYIAIHRGTLLIMLIFMVCWSIIYNLNLSCFCRRTLYVLFYICL